MSREKFSSYFSFEDRSDFEGRACACSACTGKADPPSPIVQAADEPDRTLAVGGSATGTINSDGDTDVFTFNVTSGQTYTISLRGAGAEPIADTYLWLYNQLGVLIDSNDDGGTGTNSLITFTATSTGTWEIEAGGYPGQGDIGDYRVDLFQHGADSVGNDLSTGASAAVGATTLGAIETDGDVDVYSVNLTAGDLYLFEVAGGVDYESNAPAVPPGQVDTIITIYDADGDVVTTNDDISYPDNVASAASFVAGASGEYFVEVRGYDGQTGGYALEIEEQPITGSPLDTIDWGTKVASNAITVYFADVGEMFDGVASLGWTTYEKDRAMAAFEEYARVSNLTFSVVEDPNLATFKLVTDASVDYLGYFNPPGTANEGVGVFSTAGSGWDRTGATGGLEKGGYGFITLIHEFGHALGLAHPHDDGGTSDVMPGVTGPFGSYGAFNLNQGVYTTMSYNDGWALNPAGDPPGDAYGWQSGPMALDIELIHQKYGARSHEAGNTIYTLANGNAAGTYWSAIWDTGGVDTIIHNGSAAAVIDLRAATLGYSPIGGGAISNVEGVFGGFTIANGVVIENATGGSGADRLVGNAAANRLVGRGGADTMEGGRGNDIYFVDNARDRAIERHATDGTDTVRSSVDFKLGNHVENLFLDGTAVRGTGNGLSNSIYGNATANRLDGGTGADTLIGRGGNDIYHVDHGSDRTIEAANDGTDTVIASISYRLGNHVERLFLEGSAANGIGNGLANRIVGTDGANALNGGGGSDHLIGGNGADRFLFNSAFGSDVDSILDFDSADDTILLDRTIFSGIAVNGMLSAAAFGIGTEAQDASDRILYHQATGRIFYDADGAGGADAVLFARLDPGTELTRADFIAVA